MVSPTPAMHVLLSGGGQMGAMMRAHDWSRSPLGLPETWSESLRTGIGILLNSAFPVFAAWGPELSFLYNDLFADILANKHPGALGRPFHEVWSDVWDDIEPLIARALSGEAIFMENMSFRMMRKGYEEETSFTFSYSPLRDEKGEVRGMFCTCAETTQQVRDDAEIRRLARTLEARVAEATQERDRLWRNTQDIQVVIDRQGVFRSVNPAFTAILGWSPEEVLGKSVFDFVVIEDEASTEKALVDARVYSIPVIENRYRHKDGGFRWISWVASPEGDLIYASGRHVTAEKEQAEALRLAEDALRQSQKLEAIGQLTGGVAHDFNNLLTVIRGSVDLLRRVDLAPEKRARYVDAIGDTADRAAKLTGQLLAFARRQALSSDLFDVGVSLGEVATMLETMVGSRIKLDLHRPSEAFFIEADRSQFDTAIVNMGINARDAMSGQGRLIISTGPVSGMPPIRGHAAIAGDFIAITVADNGDGIPLEQVDRIFEPFFTTKGVGQGTGLGLSQVIGFAKQSGGDIRVDSKIDEGATFTLYLPRAYPDAEHRPVEEHDRVEVNGDGVCVLVVEDNEQVGRFATAALKELGYETELATDAAQALAMLDAHRTKYHILFSDVMMPGMDGVELGQEVRRLHPHVPVILTSGYSHVLAQNGRHGFELLHKPYSVEQLSRVLRKAVMWQVDNAPIENSEPYIAT